MNQNIYAFLLHWIPWLTILLRLSLDLDTVISKNSKVLKTNYFKLESAVKEHYRMMMPQWKVLIRFP